MSHSQTYGKCSGCNCDFYDFDYTHAVVRGDGSEVRSLCGDCAAAVVDGVAGESAVFTLYERADRRLCNHGKQFSDEGIRELLREVYG